MIDGLIKVVASRN